MVASPSAGDGALIYTEAAQYLRSGRAIFSGDFDGDEIADLVFIHRVEGTETEAHKRFSEYQPLHTGREQDRKRQIWRDVDA